VTHPLPPKFVGRARTETGARSGRVYLQKLAATIEASQDDTFGLATQRIVRIWQEQLNSNPDLPQNLQGLVLNGDVDSKTAGALNWLLGTLGAFPRSRASAARKRARPPRIKPKKKASNIRRKLAKRRKRANEFR